MISPFTAPLDVDRLLRRKKAIRRELLDAHDRFDERRIAILGGSTTAEFKDMLELFLLSNGIRPIFYESDYNRYFEDLAFPSAVETFKPEIIYLHTSNVNIARYPSPTDDAGAFDQLVDSELEKFRTLWDRAEQVHRCPVIQNNFEMPHARALGNLDGYALQGHTRLVEELNRRFGDEARARSQLYINDIHYLSAWFGLERWYDLSARYAYKYAMSLQALPHLGQNVAAIINSILGRSKKCLVLDLDNTLWGGVIGDDGLGAIQLGAETAVAEGYTAFQGYVKDLKDRGVILAVCSKNDEADARLGFSHDHSTLKASDFSAFQANWDEKPINLRLIAERLSVGVDSLVFIDDNAAERDIVRAQEPLVAVPEIGDDVTRFISILDRSGLFETVSLSAEDLRRSALYADNSQRASSAARFATYDDFLRSLDMVAEIQPLTEAALERAVQLCNKTNQFNVTTRRVTTAEMAEMISSPDVITLCGRLKDKFGDNGLISLMSGDLRDSTLEISIWLMSCRVLQRGMEAAMLDRMVELARARGATSLVGRYLPTAKNNMVSGLFAEMGFTAHDAEGGAEWRLDLEAPYQFRNSIIRVNHGR